MGESASAGGTVSPGRVGSVARVLRALVWAYQQVPLPGRGRCRFAPTCSSYAYEALTAHGAARGTWLSMRRVARCHPFNPGGVDPVPAKPVARAVRS